ncbi:hypothetical protein Ae201684P_009053 [Aphanomyces euteiches]|uniref:RCC1-like domain-containing protein n=1 Tax=Aphanomyces euteiches TaxID=100861 RepID=A0A6G0WEC3_9STRA|nr:hypothetical protein Ae201684_015858 [Aphanomyces euteiches]KAH9080107.1 hypothetical protein Ae201684P_009053 [Aphanomyces euteiches]
MEPPPPSSPRARTHSRLLQASANIQAVHKVPDKPEGSSPTSRGKRRAICVVNQDSPSLIRVSTTHLHAVYGGTMAFYTICLDIECESTVVIHLLIQNDRTRAVQLSTSRLCFTPETYAIPQAVGVQATDVTHDEISIVHRVFSQDERFDQLTVPPVHLTVYGNEAAYVWTFGGDAILQEVHANAFIKRRPQLVPNLHEVDREGQPRDVYFSSISCGENFTIAVSSQSCMAFAYGQGTDGELGNHACFSTKSAVPIPCDVFATSPSDRPAIVSLSCGKHHVAVATRAGQMFTWGSGRFGQLGHYNYLDFNVPKLVHFEKPDGHDDHSAIVITYVACGGFHTLAITDAQHVVAFGHNKAGQLGLGHRQMRLDQGWRSCVPTVIDSLVNYSIHQVAAGVHHSACISTHGDLFTWGCGVDGRLGHNSTTTLNAPTLVVAAKLLEVVPRMVRCGGRHTALISDSDALYTWGANDFGQLGLGDTKPRFTPALVSFPPTCCQVILQVSLGQFHSAAVNAHGDVWTWGYDVNGGLGMDSDGSIHLEPRQVSALAGYGAVQVHCGWSHTTVLTKRNHPIRRSALSNNQEESVKSIRSTKIKHAKRPQSAQPMHRQRPKPQDEAELLETTTPVAPPASLNAFRKRMQRVRPQSAHPGSRRRPNPPMRKEPETTRSPHPFLRKNQPPRRPQTARPSARSPWIDTPRKTPEESTPAKPSMYREIARTFVGKIVHHVVAKLSWKAAKKKQQSPTSTLFSKPPPVFPVTTPRQYNATSMPPPVLEPEEQDETTPASSSLLLSSPPSSKFKTKAARKVRPKSARVDRPVPLALQLEMDKEKKRTWHEDTVESVLKEAQCHRRRLWIR